MSKLKPLVFSVKDLAYIDEPCATKNFQKPDVHSLYIYVTNPADK